MAKKVIVNVTGSLSGDKAEAIRDRIANDLGVSPSDVLVCVGMSVSVVDLPDPPPPIPPPGPERYEPKPRGNK